MNMDGISLNAHRLSDRIAFALELALVQRDLKIADVLVSALELSMTRNSGGGEFVERRDYPPEMEALLKKFKEVKGEPHA